MVSQVNISRRIVHFWIYYASLCLLAASLPASRYMITISLIILVVNWLAEGNFREKFKRFFTNKPAIAFTLIYGLSVLGLLWSGDIRYAFNNDLLHKSPTLFIPIIIVTSPVLDVKKIRLLLMFFISSVLTVSFIGLSIRIFHPETSFRDASPFITGVYYGMMLILAAFQLPLLIKQISNKRIWLLLSIAVSVWLIFFLFYLRAMTGIASFAGVAVFLITMLIGRQKNIFIKISFGIVFLLLFCFSLWIMINAYKNTQSEVETNFSALQEYTGEGNKYSHDTTNILRENGHLVFIYISDLELKDEWNAKSRMDYNGNNLINYDIRTTLFRYMSSKGLRKDRHDFILLTDSDIRAIENGVINYLYVNRPGFYVRMYEELRGVYSYRKTLYKQPSSSFAERLDQWRASWQSFKKYPLLGWGTGNILHATDYGFKKNGSTLTGRNMKPHNQYIYYLLTLGVFGLAAFILLFTYIVMKTGAFRIIMFKIFLIVFAINFLANNSLENQLGQNLFMFFSIIYCFLYPRVEPE